MAKKKQNRIPKRRKRVSPTTHPNKGRSEPTTIERNARRRTRSRPLSELRAARGASKGRNPDKSV